jgi:hypothetical protein
MGWDDCNASSPEQRVLQRLGRRRDILSPNPSLLLLLVRVIAHV